MLRRPNTSHLSGWSESAGERSFPTLFLNRFCGRVESPQNPPAGIPGGTAGSC